jgi:hypothetical protein
MHPNLRYLKSKVPEPAKFKHGDPPLSLPEYRPSGARLVRGQWVREMGHLERELAECRREFDELRAAVLRRNRLDAELIGLYRERSIQRAQATERDPALPLN